MVKSGVNPTLYSVYDFGDHLWKGNTLGIPARPDLLELAERCVRIDGSTRAVYWMKMPNSDVWEEKGEDSAKKHAMNTWIGNVLTCGMTIDDVMIETFFSGKENTYDSKGKKTGVMTVGSCPQLGGRMVIPYGPKFVTYKKKHYLNSSSISVLPGDMANIKLGQLILVMIYRALCNGDPLHKSKAAEGELLYQQVVTNTYKSREFRFVLNWLAAIVQAPGCNLQTNLWFLGEQQGVGRGTLLSIMGRIIRGGVDALIQADIDPAGYTNHLLGVCLVEVNELETNTGAKGRGMTGRQWNKWIKAHSCEVELPIKVRYGTAYRALNIGNYLFTTNDLAPIHMDLHDRRNQVIKTTDDIYWREFASIVQTAYFLPRPDDVASGFAAVLERVKVNHDLIKSAYVNQVKSDVQREGQSQAKEWTDNDVTLQLADAEANYGEDGWHVGEDYYRRFVVWIDAQGMKPNTANKWARDMRKLPCVEKRQNKDTRITQYRHVKIDEMPIVDHNTVAKDFDGFGDVVITPIDDEQVSETAPDKLSPGRAQMKRLREILLRERAVCIHEPAPDDR